MAQRIKVHAIQPQITEFDPRALGLKEEEGSTPPPRVPHGMCATHTLCLGILMCVHTQHNEIICKKTQEVTKLMTLKKL